MKKVLSIVLSVSMMISMLIAGSAVSFAGSTIGVVMVSPSTANAFMDGTNTAEVSFTAYDNTSSVSGPEITVSSAAYTDDNGLAVSTLVGGKKYKVTVVLDGGAANAFSSAVTDAVTVWGETFAGQTATLDGTNQYLTIVLPFTAGKYETVKTIEIIGFEVPTSAKIGTEIPTPYSSEVFKVKINGVAGDTHYGRAYEVFQVNNDSYTFEYNGKKWSANLDPDVYTAGKNYGVMLLINDKTRDKVAPAVRYQYDENTTVIVNGKSYKLDSRFVVSSGTPGGIIVDLGTLSAEGKFSGGDFDETATAKAAGANTGDSNDIALFSIMGLLALAGAGFVGYKKREN